MIRTYKDYKFYLEADRIALKKNSLSIKNRIRQFILPDYIWRFQKCLRKYEYKKNCGQRSLFHKLSLFFTYRQFRNLSLKLGFSIPANVFGPGLSIAHYGTIVVNHNARIGANCRIHACVNIGASGGSPEAPYLGDNIYIGPGAKLFGRISIASNTVIAANAVVNKSFEESDYILGGIPAKPIRKLSDGEIRNFIPYIIIK